MRILMIGAAMTLASAALAQTTTTTTTAADPVTGSKKKKVGCCHPAFPFAPRIRAQPLNRTPIR